MLAEIKQGDKGHIDLTNRMIRRFNSAFYSTDYPSIQAAIDAAKAAGRGAAYIPDGDYIVDTTIRCAPGVNVILSHNARLVAVADVDIIKLAPGGGVRGGIVDCSLQSPFTHAAILCDGASRFSLRPTVISDIQLLGGGTGVGMRMYAKQADTPSSVFGLIVRDFGVSGFEYGIQMATDDTPGAASWTGINANSFCNSYFVDCNYAVSLSGNVTGNLFSNITVQPSADSLRALYCGAEYNQFSNLFVWDAQLYGDGIAIEMSAGSRRNVVQTATNRIYYLDNGAENRLDSWQAA